MATNGDPATILPPWEARVKPLREICGQVWGTRQQPAAARCVPRGTVPLFRCSAEQQNAYLSGLSSPPVQPRRQAMPWSAPRNVIL